MSCIKTITVHFVMNIQFHQSGTKRGICTRKYILFCNVCSGVCVCVFVCRTLCWLVRMLYATLRICFLILQCTRTTATRVDTLNIQLMIFFVNRLAMSCVCVWLFFGSVRCAHQNQRTKHSAHTIAINRQTVA